MIISHLIAWRELLAVTDGDLGIELRDDCRLIIPKKAGIGKRFLNGWMVSPLKHLIVYRDTDSWMELFIYSVTDN